MDRLNLELQARKIETILRANDLTAIVTGGDIGPRQVNYRVSVAGERADLVSRLLKLDETLALRLAVAGVQIRRVEGQMRILVPHGRQFDVVLSSLYRRQSYPPQTMALGLDVDALQPLVLRPAHPAVSHTLVAGTTGSGKSTLMKTMIVSLSVNTTPDQAGLFLIDPKGYKFKDLAGLPHLTADIVTGVDNGAEAALACLTRLVTEMVQRDREERNTPRLYVFIEELADIMQVGGPAVEGALTRLMQRGREAGILVIAGTQKPTAEAIGSLIKANFPTRIVGAVADARDAAIVAGKNSGVEKLLGRGDFLLISKAAPVKHFQAAKTDSDFIAHVGQQDAALGVGRPTRRWEIASDEQPRSDLLGKVIPFLRGRGGWNRAEFTPKQVEDARRGMTAWKLRQKYSDLTGSRADRLAKQYGPPKEAVK